jgi:hypothetical protein
MAAFTTNAARKWNLTLGWNVWEDFVPYVGEGEKELRKTWNICCIVTLPWEGGEGHKQGRWVTWRTREWRVPSEWLNLNACSASTGGVYTIHSITPLTTRSYHGLKGGGGVLKFISTGIGAVTPMWRDAENRCNAGNTMGPCTLVTQNGHFPLLLQPASPFSDANKKKIG